MNTMTTRLGARLGRLSDSALRARIRVRDENGEKGRPAVRCGIEARVPRRRAIHVSACATSAPAALADALDKLERLLRRQRESARDRRRRFRTVALAAGGR
jgi:ribosome-associated translation inhibitor RaiA